jgi:signal recognition particle receptor subunit beta
VHKIIFSGPVGAGKTTAIGAVSDIDPVVTDVRPSDGTAGSKQTTTVAMDYGALALDSGERVHLFGAPGQERFDFMWEILAEGATGLILLISNARLRPLADLQLYLRAFDPLIRRTRLAVGVTGMDLVRDPPLDSHRRVLHDAGLRHPVFEVDARRRQDVAILIQALLLSQDPQLATAPS